MLFPRLLEKEASWQTTRSLAAGATGGLQMRGYPANDNIGRRDSVGRAPSITAPLRFGTTTLASHHKS